MYIHILLYTYYILHTTYYTTHHTSPPSITILYIHIHIYISTPTFILRLTIPQQTFRNNINKALMCTPNLTLKIILVVVTVQRFFQACAIKITLEFLICFDSYFQMRHRHLASFLYSQSVARRHQVFDLKRVRRLVYFSNT